MPWSLPSWARSKLPCFTFYDDTIGGALFDEGVSTEYLTCSLQAILMVRSCASAFVQALLRRVHTGWSVGLDPVVFMVSACSPRDRFKSENVHQERRD